MVVATRPGMHCLALLPLLIFDTVLGNYGGCNTAWHALAAIRANTDLKKYHTKRYAKVYVHMCAYVYVRARVCVCVCMCDPPLSLY
jgi:hypothetical protein